MVKASGREEIDGRKARPQPWRACSGAGANSSSVDPDHERV
jgi:hypothetical protein